MKLIGTIKLKPLLISLLIPLGLGSLVGLILAVTGQFADYAELFKPPLSPPGWVFFVAWTLLYALMGISSYLVLTADVPVGTRSDALWLYFVQLGVNLLWPILFFYFDMRLAAFLWIIVLIAAVVKMIVSFWFISKPASLLPKLMLDQRFHITLLFVPICGILIFSVLPLIYMICIAFTNYDHDHQVPGNLFDWVGFANFGNMLGGNKQLGTTFFGVLVWTLIWAFFATFSNYFLGIIVALVINTKGLKFKKVFRSILVLTIAMPQFISLLVMRSFFSGYGVINRTLINLGILGSINDAIPFLTDPTLAKVIIIIVNMWIGIPYTMLMSSGILMNIPQDLYEAATVDGANKVQMFFKITLPQIIFTTTPYLITSFVGNINNFNVIYLLTAGGPKSTEYYVAGKTDLLVTWLYSLTKTQMDYNLASTIGILIFVISAVLSLITYTNSKSYKEEDSFQ